MPGKCVRGTVLEVNLDPVVGHETGKTRPCVVIQNDIGNAKSPVTIVAVITGAEHVPKLYPVNVLVRQGEGGLTKDSVILCNQLKTVDELRFVRICGVLTDATMEKVDEALKISLAL
jgi:mRNA interferase MazF